MEEKMKKKKEEPTEAMEQVKQKKKNIYIDRRLETLK